MTEHPDQDRELELILDSLEDGTAPTPDYADRLWASLESTLDRRPAVRTAPTPGTGPTDDLGARTEPAAEIVELQAAGDRPTGRRWQLIAAAVAAAAAAVGILLVVDNDQEPIETFDDVSPTTTVAPTTTLPLLSEPAAACARYFDSPGALHELVDADLTDVDFEAALVAIEQLQADLMSSPDLTPSAISSIDIARGALLQAAAEVELGELARARISLETAADAVELPDPATGDAQCRPADD